jgi:predicted PurR-regulated permease PerM
VRRSFGERKIAHPRRGRGVRFSAEPIRCMIENGGVRRITWRLADVARVLTLVVLFMFAWRFFWAVYNAILMLVLAILIAMMIHAPAQFLSRWMPFRVGFGVTVVGFLTAIAGLVIAVIPQIVDQISQLALQLPAAMIMLTDWFEHTLGGGGERASDLPQRINEQIADFIGRFAPMAFNLITAVFGLIAVLVLAIFLAAQPEVYREVVLSMTPPASRDKIARVYDEAGRNLQLWVIGKGFTMLGVGLFTYLGLLFFEIPGALALGALAAVLEFIPNLGPTLAAIPAIIAAFLISPTTALYVAIFYFILQQIQSALTVPLIERRAVNIPSAVLLIWQLALAIGFGFLALFVATPLLAVIVVAARILYYEPMEALSSHDRREAEAAAAEARHDEAADGEASGSPSSASPTGVRSSVRHLRRPG